MSTKKYFLLAVIAAFVAFSLSGCLLTNLGVQNYPPQLLSPQNGATSVSTNVKLSWKDSSAQGLGYRLFFGTSEEPSFAATTAATSLDLSALEYSTTYYWKVSAVDQNGKTSTSSVRHFTTVSAPIPSTPVLNVSEVSTDSVTVEWSKASDTSTFTVYSASSGNFSVAGVLSGNGNSFVAKNLAPSTVYRFFVVASNEFGSATSDTVSATTLPLAETQGAPTVSGLKTTDVSTDTVSLEWASENASYASVYLKASGNFSKIATLPGTAESYVAKNLAPSTGYGFYVAVSNPSGSATSETVSATTASSSNSGGVSDFSVYLTDKPISISDVSAVYVELTDISVHTSGGEGWTSVLSTPTVQNLVDLVGTAVSVATKSMPSSGLVTQIRLEVASATLVMASNTYNLSVPSGKIMLNVAPFTISQASSVYLDFDLSNSIKETGNGRYTFSPVIHSVSGKARAYVVGKVVYGATPVVNATVSLGDSSEVVSQTYTKAGGKFSFAAVNSGSYTLTIEASGLSADYETTVNVSKGRNDLGTVNIGNSPAPVPTPTTSPLASPVLSVGTVTSTSVVLNWTESSTDVSGFKVFKSDGTSEDFETVATLPGTALSYTDSISTDATAYRYKVSAFNSEEQAFSNVVTVNSTASTPVAVLGIVSISTTPSGTVGSDQTLVVSVAVDHSSALTAATATLGTLAAMPDDIESSPITFEFADLSSLPAGTNTVKVEITDSTGKTVSAATQVYVEKPAPAISEAYRDETLASSPIVVVFSEDVHTLSGFASSDIVLTGAAVTYKAATGTTISSTGLIKITDLASGAVSVPSSGILKGSYTVTVGDGIVNSSGSPVSNQATLTIE